MFQKETAEAIGIPMGTYVAYERAETNSSGEPALPPVRYLYLMAKHYEVTMEELLGLEPLSGNAVKAALRENDRLRDRLRRYESFDVAMPYIERAHRDMGRLLETIAEEEAPDAGPMPEREPAEAS
jgi:transcriptional regulator with XRE-family HTH domain